jgi:hypothetical protein
MTGTIQAAQIVVKPAMDSEISKPGGPAAYANTGLFYVNRRWALQMTEDLDVIDDFVHLCDE